MDTRKDNVLFGEYSFVNIDLTDTIKQYYKIFDQISAGVISKRKEFYSNEYLAKMPKGYFSKDKKIEHYEYLMGRMTTEHTIPYMWVSSAGYDFKPNMSVYDSEQGYTKEQIFVAFLKNE